MKEKPFFVIATENPVESEGTFPLPEAQKDRFMLSLSIGYPSVEDEIQLADRMEKGDLPAMIISALIMIVPIALIILIIMIVAACFLTGML